VQRVANPGGEKLIPPFWRGGYLVGRPGTSVTPVRRDIGKLGLRIPKRNQCRAQNRVFGRLSRRGGNPPSPACLILANSYYRVGLRVTIWSQPNRVREFSVGLHERGLIAKDPESPGLQSVDGGIGSQRAFQVRQLLEPERFAWLAIASTRRKLLNCWTRASRDPGYPWRGGLDALDEISWNSASSRAEPSISSSHSIIN